MPKSDKTASRDTSPSSPLVNLAPIASRERHDGVVDVPPLPHGTILLVEVGSTAHGTGLPGGEDQDETAIVIESPARFWGLIQEVRQQSCSGHNQKAREVGSGRH
jgi:hypothetical protein